MSCRAIFCAYKKANEANQAEGAVILQLIMQYFGGNLSLLQLQRIILTVLERITKKIEHDFLRAR